MSTNPGEAFGLPRHAVPDESVDATPDTPLDPAAFDLGTWIAGVTATVRSCTLYQRPDLLADIDELERRLTIAGKTAKARGPEGEDTLDDHGDDVDTISAQLTNALHEFAASAVTFRVQGRTDEWRDAAEKRLKKQGIRDETEIILRQLAESVVAPAGITYEHLAHLNTVSQPQIKMLLVAWQMANVQPPRANVDVPFSPASSPKKSGRQS